MSDRKRRRLKNLQLTRIDLVDQGAAYDAATGEGAHVLLYKSAGGVLEVDKSLPTPADVHTDKPLDEEEIDKAAACKCGEPMEKGWGFCPKCGEKSGPMDAAKSAAEGGAMPEDNVTPAVEPAPEDAPVVEAAPVADVAKQAEELTKLAAERDELAKRAEDLEKRATEAEAKLAEANVEIAKRADEAKTAEFVKRAETEFGNLPAQADALGALLKRLHASMAEADVAEVERLLKVNDGKVAPLTKEIGRPGADTQSRTASEELDALTKAEIEKSAGKLKYADAMALVAKANPELYDRQRREVSTPAKAN